MKKNILEIANKLFTAGEFYEALQYYMKFIEMNPSLESCVAYNKKKCISMLKGWVPLKTKKYNFESFGEVLHYPLVSIIIVSYNSASSLTDVFLSIKGQSYKNIEIIVVENGTEDTEILCKQYFSSFKYIKCNNVGFAEGNNIGATHAKGEFILLLNPDARMETDCIQELIDSIRYDKTAAIAAPKIYFYEKFIRFNFCALQPYKINLVELLGQLGYKKIFIRSGMSDGGYLIPDKNGVLSIDISCDSLSKLIVLFNSSAKQILNVSVGFSNVNFITHPDENVIELEIDHYAHSSSRYIVNNAGSGFDQYNNPYDRGYGEYDDGKYYPKTYLSAFCGCCALIRRLALIDRPVFLNEFFAYFEDTELSRFIINKNQKILYVPSAIVFHKHSESTDENSPVWNALVSRSRYIFDSIKNNNLSSLKNIKFSYDDVPKSLKLKLSRYDANLRTCVKLSDLSKNQFVTVCIYNSYFSTYGGGERHALSFIKYMPKDWNVYLLSENDFSIVQLEKFFDIDLSRCVKLISKHIDTYITQQFDLFINATFRSNLLPNARHNLYIVSFPHQNLAPGLAEKYIFLHNSNFTKDWAINLWGKHDFNVVEPTLSYQPNVPRQLLKEKVILNVGRFNSAGHCKNQHLIIKAFLELTDKKVIDSDWKLVLIGTCDNTSKDSVEYLESIRQITKDRMNVKLLVNLTNNDLTDFYMKSSVYVHATGLNCSVNRPDLHEHFGITVFEAMTYGCFPIVYSFGGPAYQVEGLDGQSKYSNFNELKESMVYATSKHLSIDSMHDVKKYAKNRFKLNADKVSAIFTRMVFNRANKNKFT